MVEYLRQNFQGYFRRYLASVEYHNLGQTIHFGSQVAAEQISFDRD